MYVEPEKYYKILGVGPNATLAEIKRAYHLRAKELHPDRNKSPNANQDFDLLHDAYDYLVGVKTGKIAAGHSKQEDDFVKWWRQQEARTRQAARTRPRTGWPRYKQREDVEDDTTNDAVNTVSNVFLLLGTFVLTIVIPVCAIILKGWTGFWVSVIIIFVTLPVTATVIPQLSRLRDYVHNLKGSFIMVSKTNWFMVMLLIVLNILLFFNITLNTLVTGTFLFFFFALLPLATYIAFLYPLKNYKYYNRKLTISFCLLPLAVNLVLLVNYLVSFNPVNEHHFFGPDGRSIAIRLENNEYDDYVGVRFFVNDDKPAARGNTIVYTFKEGIFGLRVMTAHEIIYRDRSPVYND